MSPLVRGFEPNSPYVEMNHLHLHSPKANFTGKLMLNSHSLHDFISWLVK